MNGSTLFCSCNVSTLINRLFSLRTHVNRLSFSFSLLLSHCNFGRYNFQRRFKTMAEHLNSQWILKLKEILTCSLSSVRIADRNISQLTKQADTVQVILRIQLRHFARNTNLKLITYTEKDLSCSYYPNRRTYLSCGSKFL